MEGKIKSQIVAWRLVLMILSFLGDVPGSSPKPTMAINEVQYNISMMPMDSSFLSW